LDAQLLVRPFRPNTAIMLAHNPTLRKGSVARFIVTSVEHRIFTFSAGSKSLSIDNAVLGPITKSLLFTIAMKTDFVGSLYRNP